MVRKRYLIILSLALLAGVVYFADPVTTWQYLRTVNVAYLPVFFVLPVVSMGLRTLRWQFLLDSTVRTRLLRLFPVQNAGIALSNLTPGRLGEPAKALLLKKAYDVPASRSLMSIIWERVLDLVITIGFSVLFMLDFLGRLSPSIMWLGQVGVGVMALGCVVVVLAIRSENVGMKMLRMIERLPVLNKVITEEFVRSFYGTGRIPKRKIALAFIVTLAAWMVDGFTYFLAFASLGMSLPYIFFMNAMSFSTICGLVSFLPGGIGSAEAVLLFALMLLGIGKSQATAGILLARGMTLGYCLLLGVLFMLYIDAFYTKPEKA